MPPTSGSLALLLAACCFATSAVAACSRPMHVQPEHWPPYTIIEDKKVHGLDIELAQAIFKEAGCTLSIDPAVPVARRLNLFNLGQTDLMLAASSTPARRQQAWFSVPYRLEEIGVFTLPEHAGRFREAISFEALLKMRTTLLVPRLGWYGQQYALAEPRLRQAGLLSEFTGFDQAVKMLAAGRAQVLMGDDAAIHYAARQLGVALSHLPFTATRDPVHIMFNKSRVSEADVEAINGAIQRLEKNGVLRAIRKRYDQP